MKSDNTQDRKSRLNKNNNSEEQYLALKDSRLVIRLLVHERCLGISRLLHFERERETNTEVVRELTNFQNI